MQIGADDRLFCLVRLRVTAMAALLVVAPISLGPMADRAAAGPHLSRYSGGSAPAEFSGLCSRSAWACSNSGTGNVRAGKTMLSVAKSVNAQFNPSIAPRTDQQAYGRSEYWTLPDRGVGDCEDYALAKQKALIEQGVPPNRLYLAAVVGSPQDPHMVLVMRTDSGDYVLDNLSARVKPWQATRYTFMKMQSSRDRRRWDTVLLGPRALRR
jgi:predicted transglutaminase-like cysteine proteinase